MAAKRNLLFCRLWVLQ